MKNLFTFGDSNTAGDPCFPGRKYYDNYTKTEEDIIWPKIIARDLNLNLVNYGLGGSSNDTIFDTVLKKWDEIQRGDTVIISKSFYHRFDITDPTGKYFVQVNPMMLLYPMISPFSKEDVEHITHTMMLMDTQVNRNRQDMRFDFLKQMLIEQKKVKTCILWGIQDNNLPVTENIIEATNGDIDDYHWSYAGHRVIGEWMKIKIEKYLI